jgi:hypothetical protein
MTRQVTDNLYIELDYYYPEEYYAYEAEAAADMAAEATVACDVGVIRSAASVITVETQVAAAISHIEGADLFAFSEALLDIEVQLIRDNNVQATAVFDTATDGRLFRDILADGESLFDIDVVNQRSREAIMETQAAFSFDVVQDVVKDANSDLISSFGDMDVTADKFAGQVISLDSDTDQDIIYTRVREFQTPLGPYRVPREVTLIGDPNIDINIKQVGIASISFDGSTDHLSVAYAPEFRYKSSSQTIEMWIYTKENRTSNISGVVTPTLISQSTGSGFTGTTWNWAFGPRADGRVVLLWRSPNQTWTELDDRVLPLNTWAHIAWTYDVVTDRNRIFINGVPGGNFSLRTRDVLTNDVPIRIGFSGSEYFGNVDELRISNTVRYTTNFTPPTTPFANDLNTLLLIHGEPVIEDDGGKPPPFMETTLVVDTGTIKPAFSEMNSQASAAAGINAIFDHRSALTSAASLSCIISHIEGADIVAEGFAELSADVGVIRQGQSDLITDSTLEVDVGVIKQAASDALAEVSFESLVGVVKPGSAEMSAEATVAADALRILPVIIDLTAETSSVVSVTRVVSFSMVLESSFVPIIANPTPIYGADIEMYVEGFALSTGFIYHINEQVYKIPRENRSWTILAENRTAKIRR